MKDYFKISRRRFMSDVPAWVAKLQILLGAAASSLGTIAAISWPGKSAVIGEACAYGAAGCGGLAIALQFIEKAIGIIEAPASVMQVPETVSASA